jgi:hypothetical protein
MAIVKSRQRSSGGAEISRIDMQRAERDEKKRTERLKKKAKPGHNRRKFKGIRQQKADAASKVLTMPGPKPRG